MKKCLVCQTVAGIMPALFSNLWHSPIPWDYVCHSGTAVISSGYSTAIPYHDSNICMSRRRSYDTIPIAVTSCLFYSLRAEDFDGSRAGCAHLRTLQLLQVPMDVVITLITHLESFVLSNSSVEGTYRCEQRCVYSSLFSSLDRVALRTFRNCIANHFTHLRRLQFAFYLPVETILEEVDLNWFHLDHDAVHSHVDKILLLYTSPYLFHQQRHLYNHPCKQTSTSNETIEHLQWTLDCDPSVDRRHSDPSSTCPLTCALCRHSSTFSTCRLARCSSCSTV